MATKSCYIPKTEKTVFRYSILRASLHYCASGISVNFRKHPHVYPRHHLLRDGIPLCLFLIHYGSNAIGESIPIDLCIGNAIEFVRSKKKNEERPQLSFVSCRSSNKSNSL